VLKGPDSLRHRRDPGRASRLGAEQTARLSKVLARSPRASGIETDCWMRVLVRDLIFREFGVSYHLAHVSRLLRIYGASFIKAPIRLRR
jgi:transposase